MNDQNLDKKLLLDAVRVKKDLSTLVEDSAVRLGRIESGVSQATIKAKDDLTTWVEESVTQISSGVGKMTHDVKKTLTDSAAAVKTDVGQGMNKYNTRVQKIADQVPGDFSKKVARYPWVSISIVLVIGLLMGIVFTPTRHSPVQS